MEWEHAKNYTKNFRTNLAWIMGGVALVVLAVVALQQGGAMIDYYCSAGSPSVFGIHLQNYLYCPLYAVVGIIFFFTVLIMLAWFLIVVGFDSTISIFKRVTGIGVFKNYSFNYLRRGENEKQREVQPKNIRHFSENLDEEIKGKTFSSLGMVFIQNVKASPPFLGIPHEKPVIPPEHEKPLTEYFQAVEFFKRNILLIKGGGEYTCKENETEKEIAESVYGDQKFSIQLLNANPGGHPFRTGEVINLPRIDISGKALTEEIELMDMIYQDKHGALKKVLRYSADELHLTYKEALPLMEHIYTAAQKTRDKKNKQAKTLPKSQDKKDALKYYDDIQIYYQRLTESEEEMRASFQSRTSTDDKRLPYWVTNVGDAVLKECRIRMMELKVVENLSTNTGGFVDRHEDKLLKWRNSDKERINLGFNAPEVFILAQIPDNNAISMFNFVTYNTGGSSRTPKVINGTWEVLIQIEGQAEKNGIIVELMPLQFTILFKFINSKLQHSEIHKHER